MSQNHGHMINVDVGKNDYNKIMQLLYVCSLNLPQFLIEKMTSLFLFFFFELLLYKTFRDFHKDIGHTNDEIMLN